MRSTNCQYFGRERRFVSFLEGIQLLPHNSEEYSRPYWLSRWDNWWSSLLVRRPKLERTIRYKLSFHVSIPTFPHSEEAPRSHTEARNGRSHPVPSIFGTTFSPQTFIAGKLSFPDALTHKNRRKRIRNFTAGFHIFDLTLRVHLQVVERTDVSCHSHLDVTFNCYFIYSPLMKFMENYRDIEYSVLCLRLFGFRLARLLPKRSRILNSQKLIYNGNGHITYIWTSAYDDRLCRRTMAGDHSRGLI